MKDLDWRGNSKKVFMDFPEECHDDFGHALRILQKGQWPAIAKALPEVGDGVSELRLEERGVAYRVVFIVKIGDAVYVLHCFKKDAAKGKKTRKHEFDTANRRLKELKRELGIN
jgi:phage-related protein